MTHFLKTKPEYYQAVIDGSKPFEIRKNDRKFKTGDKVCLMEYLGKEFVEECSHCRKQDCEGWKAIEDIPEYGEDEAIENCGRNRSYCSAYYREKYSGRRCFVQINQIFDLTAAGLSGYIAFTFETLETKEESPYNLAERAEE